MRPILIICVLLVTGLTFFAATQSIDDKAYGERAQKDAVLAAERRAEVDRAQNALVEAKALNAANVRRLEAIIEAQTADHAERVSELEQSLEAHAVVEADRDALTATNAQLVTQTEAARADSKQSKDRLLDAQATISDIKQVVKERQTRVETLELQLKNWEAKAVLSAERMAELEQQARPKEPVVTDDMLAELQALKQRNEDARATFETRISALATEVDAHKKRAANSDTRAKDLEMELTSLRTALIKTTSALEQNKAHIANLEDGTIGSLDLTAAICTEKSNALLASKKIRFKTGTDLFDESSAGLLKDLADVAFDCAHADLLVTIGGHTDSQGGERSNQKLSEKRAAAIRNLFGTHGLPSASMRVVGYGESEPIADNNTSTGRAKNRRITFDWQNR